VAGGGGLGLGLRGRRTELSHRVPSLAETAAAALIAALIAVGIVATVERYLTGVLLNQVTARALDHVEVGVVPHVTALDFEPPYTTDKLNDIDSRVDVILARALEDGSGILRLNLYASDGTILYSDLASLRGQAVSPLSDALMRGALSGSSGAALVSLGGRTTADLVAGHDSALEACVPLILNGQVVGVYALYEDPAPIYALRPPVWGLAAMIALASFVMMRATPRLLARRPTTPPARQRPPPNSTLTRREMQVLHLLAQGCTNRVIGDRLVISEETTRTHVKSILHKLGEPNRASAVDAARRAGLLPGETRGS